MRLLLTHLVYLFVTISTFCAVFPNTTIAQTTNPECSTITDQHAKQFVYSLPYEDSAILAYSDSGCTVVEHDNSASSVCTSMGNPDFSKIPNPNNVVIQHTHPLDSFAHPAFDTLGGGLNAEERQKVCDGTRIPPAAQPSGIDWIPQIALTADDSAPNIESKVYDPGGVWTFKVQDKNDPAVLAMLSMINGVAPEEAMRNLTSTQKEAINDIMDFGPSTRPLSPTQSIRDARIQELEEHAAQIGLSLQYEKNEFSDGGKVIPNCAPSPDAQLDFSTAGTAGACILGEIPISENTKVESGDTKADSSGGGDTSGDGSKGGGIFSSLVPCGINTKAISQSDGGVTYEDECTICHLQILAQNIIRFLVAISVAVAALLFANAGFLYVTSPGNAGNISRAHHLFTSTLVGIIIILVAYLLVDTILKMTLKTEGGVGVVYKSEGAYGPWNKILCGESGPKNSYTVAGIEPVKNTVTPATPSSPNDPGVSCASLKGECGVGLTCKTGTQPKAGTDCEKNFINSQCCIPKESGTTCTLASGASGTCQGESFCSTTGETVGTCGSTLKCCPTQTAPQTPTTPGNCTCTDEACLKAKYKGSPSSNAPQLSQLINCYLSDPTVSSLVDNNKLYTYENDNPKCNWTNGEEVCGKCAHSDGSCHYGGGTGLGALGVDFNAKVSSKESQLHSALEARKSACAQFTKKIIYESDHTHISHKDCPNN